MIGYLCREHCGSISSIGVGYRMSSIRNWTAMGLKIAQQNPDVFLVMYGGDHKAVDMTVMMDYEVYTVGRLKLALYDAKSNEEIWWAETRADLFHHMTPEEKDRTIAFAVHRILEHYPPTP